jgi:FkbH-like protein
MREEKEIKCVIWDLDHTLWDGILLESEDVRLKPNVVEVLQVLDSRGILHSIASNNSHDDAMRKLKRFGLDEYFIYPEITWRAKSLSIEKIQKNLNVGMDSLLFIDDQPFERDEVKTAHPSVLCVDASKYLDLPHHPRLNPRFVTLDSKRRRHMYLQDINRKKEEYEYEGPKIDFLASCNMSLIISKAKEEDLKRAEELTIRTNQLNATGKTYSYDELKSFITSDRHELLICELTDKYGPYGKIGLSLVEMNEEHWNLRLLVVSCRVMTHGVGTILLSHIMQKAKKANKKLLADFKHTGKNKLMYISFKFANFTVLNSDESGSTVFQNDLTAIQQFPPYIQVTIR